MSDFAFLADIVRPDPILQRKKHIEEIRREGFKQKLKHISNDAEQLQDYCRGLMRSGADVNAELKQLEAVGHGLVLVALLLKRESV